MNSTYAIVKDDYEQIQAIQQKWKYQDIKKELKQDYKRLELILNEEQNQHLHLPDVFITTKQYHEKPTKSKNEKKQSSNFSQKLRSISLSKNERNIELSTLESNYKKFKKYFYSRKQSPKNEILNQCVSIPRNYNFQKIDGVKFPQSLYTIHKIRRDKLDDIFRNQTCENSIHKYQQYEQENQKQQLLKQKINKQKEYTSRSYLNNSYFTILSLNKDCRQKVKTLIQYTLPKESRFQQF